MRLKFNLGLGRFNPGFRFNSLSNNRALESSQHRTTPDRFNKIKPIHENLTLEELHTTHRQENLRKTLALLSNF